MHLWLSIIYAYSQDEFPGLLPLVRMYINSVEMDVETRCTILQYLRVISKRASGEFQTTSLPRPGDLDFEIML